VRWITFLGAVLVAPLVCVGQQAPPNNTASRSIPAQPAAAQAPQPEPKRIFGIIPNYRTSPTLAQYKPLTRKQKFKIAAQDSFDWGAVLMALTFAGAGQLTNANPSFGQGASGFARYFGAGYADVVIGNMMTEAIYPSLLRQDPRYFRRGTGGGWSRLGYAMSRIVVTHKDSGGRTFNYSEFLGNATAVAISNSYYPDARDAATSASRFGVQIGLDMAGFVAKEFAPDIMRKLSRQPKANGGTVPVHK
jgi:hypothetical protein